MWLVFPSDVMALDCLGMAVGTGADASDATGASATCSQSRAFCTLVRVPLSCWRARSANSSFLRDWMRSSEDSWNVAAAGSSNTPNRRGLAVLAVPLVEAFLKPFTCDGPWDEASSW